MHVVHAYRLRAWIHVVRIMQPASEHNSTARQANQKTWFIKQLQMQPLLHVRVHSQGFQLHW